MKKPKQDRVWWVDEDNVDAAGDRWTTLRDFPGAVTVADSVDGVPVLEVRIDARRYLVPVAMVRAALDQVRE